MTTPEEQISNIKVNCPECKLPHSLSTKDVDYILSLIKSIVPEKINIHDKRYPDYCECNEQCFGECELSRDVGWNKCIQEIINKIERRI